MVEDCLSELVEQIVVTLADIMGECPCLARVWFWPWRFLTAALTLRVTLADVRWKLCAKLG